jgi:hypothetical protein
MNGLALMSKLRKKSTITIIILISLSAIIVFSQYIQFVSAWDNEELMAPINESRPIIDGQKDSIWSDANSTENDSPALRLDAMIYGSYLFILVEVRVVNHDNDEYVKLLLSNSTDSEEDDFVDAKLIQTRNFSNPDTRSFFTEDQYYDEGSEGYLVDPENNFEGAANISSGANSYSYYEFGIPTSTVSPHDYAHDTSISFEDSYAITVQFGDHEQGGTPTIQETGVITLSFEQPPEDIEPEGEFPIPIWIVTTIVFSIAGVGFIIIAVISYQSRTRL